MQSLLSEIRTVFREEVRRTTRRIWYRVMTLVVPAVLLVLLIAVPLVRGLTSGGGEGGGSAVGRIGLMDLSGELVPEGLIKAGYRVFPDREAGVAALLADEIRSLFIIPQDYLRTGRVEWLHTGSSISASMSAEEDTGGIQLWLREALVKDALRPEVKTRFLWPARFESIVVEEGGSTKEGAKEVVGVFSVSYIFSFLLMMAVLTGSGYLLQSVSEEKESRMIELVLTSISPLGLMAGKVLALGLAGLLQVTVWGASIVFMGPGILENFPSFGQLTIDPVLLVWVAAFFLAGYFVFGVINAGIGAATTSYRQGSSISTIFLVPSVLVPMWLFIFIAGNPEGTLAQILSFIPFTAPVTMMLRLGAADIPLVEIIASLAVTLFAGIVLLWGSARVFRAGLLMYGQRMSLRRVLKALREAG
jgi:ABC-2 type transport system permease protein